MNFIDVGPVVPAEPGGGAGIATKPSGPGQGIGRNDVPGI